MAILPFSGSALNLNALNAISDSFPNTEKMPALFLGHGSPMNAIEENEFVTGFRSIGKALPMPNAILCISAHWETKGTYVTAMEQPRTIHDFGGFPQALFDVQYPAPGSPQLAVTTQQTISLTKIEMDHQWGLDHGCWSVVKHLYPEANVPIIQLSIDYTQPAQYHYELGKQLSALRSKGILLIGSGNMVHNLGLVAWQKLNQPGFGFDWAIEASEKMKQWIAQQNHSDLINFKNQGKAFELAIPTPEHYLPLLYILAMQGKNEEANIFNDSALGGSLTMTSVKIQ